MSGYATLGDKSKFHSHTFSPWLIDCGVMYKLWFQWVCVRHLSYHYFRRKAAVIQDVENISFRDFVDMVIIVE